MGLLLQAREQRLPVADAVAFNAQQIDVRGGTEQPVLQVLAESVVDGQRDDERSHAAATPTMEMTVMTPMTACRRLARK